MKIILEKTLDFKQFQNLIILTFCFVMTLLAMQNSLEFGTYFLLELFLFSFSLLFIAILFTKKGFYKEGQNLYSGVFLFGRLIYKKLLPVSDFKYISLIQGKLSTNYNYSYKIEVFHNWEPDLNVSIPSFTVCLIGENENTRKRIFTLTNSTKANDAIDFVLENTDLKYGELRYQYFICS